MVHETRKRSIVKAISYRIFGTIITMLIVYSFTGKFVLSLGVGFIDIFSKLALFYVHERVWHKVKWGKYLKQ